MSSSYDLKKFLLDTYMRQYHKSKTAKQKKADNLALQYDKKNADIWHLAWHVLVRRSPGYPVPIPFFNEYLHNTSTKLYPYKGHGLSYST